MTLELYIYLWLGLWNDAIACYACEKTVNSYKNSLVATISIVEDAHCETRTHIEVIRKRRDF